MDTKQKLALMKKYHFQGFGGFIAFVGDEIFEIANSPRINPEQARKSLQIIFKYHKRMQDCYDRINFPELESLTAPEDREDFGILFKTREVLPKLAEAARNYEALLSRGTITEEERVEYNQMLKEVYGELDQAHCFGGCRFRTRIENLEKALRDNPS